MDGGGFLDVQCGDNRYHKNKQQTLPSVSGGGSEFADLVGSLGTKTPRDQDAGGQSGIGKGQPLRL